MSLTDKLSSGVKKFAAGLTFLGASIAAQPALAQESEKKLDNPNTYEESDKKDTSLFSPVAFYGQLRHVQNDFKPANSTSDLQFRITYRPSRTDRLFFDFGGLYAHGENEQGKRLDSIVAPLSISYGKYADLGNNSWLFFRIGANGTYENHQGMMDADVARFGAEGQIGFVKDRFMTDLKVRGNIGVYDGKVQTFPIEGNTSQLDLKWDIRIPTPLKELSVEAGAQYTMNFFGPKEKNQPTGYLDLTQNTFTGGLGLAISPEDWMVIKPGAYIRHENEESGMNSTSKVYVGAQLIGVFHFDDTFYLKAGGAYDTKYGGQVMGGFGFKFK